MTECMAGTFGSGFQRGPVHQADGTCPHTVVGQEAETTKPEAWYNRPGPLP